MVYMGPFMGPNLGPKLGVNSRYGSSATPKSLMESYLGHSVTNLWVGGKLADEVSGLTWTNTGDAVAVEQALAGTIDGGGITNGMYIFDDDADQLIIPNTTNLQADGATDAVWLAVLRWTATTAGDIFGTRTASAGNAGFEIRRPNTTSFGHTWDDGGSTVFGSALGSAAVNDWHVIAAAAYETGEDYHIADSDGAGASSSEFNKTMGDMTSDRGFSLGDGRTTCARFQCAMFLYLEGAAASNYSTGGLLKGLCNNVHQWVIDGTPP